MTWSAFFKYLSYVTLALIIWTLGISRMGDHSHTLWIYLISILTFVIFSALIFLYALNTSASDHLFSFNNVVVASFLIKLILSVGMIMIFEKIFEPTSKIHILHFIIVYLIYTVYEVYFLTKLARSAE